MNWKIKDGSPKVLEYEVDQKGNIEALVVGWHNYAVLVLVPLLIIIVLLHCL